MTSDARVVWMPGGVRTQLGRRIVLFNPAGIEDFFLEAGSPTPQRETDVAAAVASATRYGPDEGRNRDL